MTAQPPPIAPPVPSGDVAPAPEASTKPATKPVWRSQDLLQGGEQAQILHAGAIYWLRRTGNGKLILVK